MQAAWFYKLSFDFAYWQTIILVCGYNIGVTELNEHTHVSVFSEV